MEFELLLKLGSKFGEMLHVNLAPLVDCNSHRQFSKVFRLLRFRVASGFPLGNLVQTWATRRDQSATERAHVDEGAVAVLAARTMPP